MAIVKITIEPVTGNEPRIVGNNPVPVRGSIHADTYDPTKTWQFNLPVTGTNPAKNFTSLLQLISLIQYQTSVDTDATTSTGNNGDTLGDLMGAAP